MISQLEDTYRKIEDARPLVRPAYNDLEVALLPPYGDPEVDIPGEVGTYVVAGLAVNTAVELLDGD
jgi:hypothetical protein